MANLNKVFLIGNLTRDPELRYTNTGLAVANLGLAVNRRTKTAEGEQREETCFVDISAFGRQAEVVSEYLSKGRPVLVEGRLQFRQWESQDGQRRSKLSVVMENFQFMDYKRSEGGAPSSRSAPPQQSAPPPQSDPPPQSAPPPDDAPPDLPDDEIPF